MANTLRRGTVTASETGAADQAALRLVERFVQLVESKPRAGLPIGHYAAVLGVSESRLTSQCRRIAGVSPLQIINACIVRTAMARMRETKLPANAIAFGLGFRDPAYFSRFFRLRTGQTPTEYRTAARIQPATVQESPHCIC